MKRIRTVEVGALAAGQRVRIEGWLHSRRNLGGITFLVIRDGWGTLQAVSESNEETLDGLGLDSVLAVEGTVTANAKAPGGIELHELAIEVISAVREPLPILLGKKQTAGITAMLDHAVVANRHLERDRRPGG
jgi:nondiscriminating aspartyl-tRNA synthetase